MGALRREAVARFIERERGGDGGGRENSVVAIINILCAPKNTIIGYVASKNIEVNLWIIQFD